MTTFPPQALAAAQEAAEARVAYLEEMLIDGESDKPPVVGGEEYCGCTTCQVREIITAVVPILEAAAEEAEGTAIEIALDYQEAGRDHSD